MILNRVVIVLAFIMQHTLTNAQEPIQSEAGKEISYLRGDFNNRTISSISTEMSHRNLSIKEKCNIPPGTYFIQSVGRGTNMEISTEEDVLLYEPRLDDAWQNIQIRSLGDNKYAIKSPWLETYLRVPKSGNKRTVNTQYFVDDFETFYITCFDNGEVAFKSKKHGNYLHADEGRWQQAKVDTYTFNDPSKIGRNAKWRLITEGVQENTPNPEEKTYYIQSKYGTYIRMRDESKVDLAPHKKSYERITLRNICYVGNCKLYAIESATHDRRYLRVPGSGTGRRVDSQTYVGDYEMFYIKTKANGKVTFESKFHDTFFRVTARDKSKLTTSLVAGTQGQFTLIPV